MNPLGAVGVERRFISLFDVKIVHGFSSPLSFRPIAGLALASFLLSVFEMATLLAAHAERAMKPVEMTQEGLPPAEA